MSRYGRALHRARQQHQLRLRLDNFLADLQAKVNAERDRMLEEALFYGQVTLRGPRPGPWRTALPVILPNRRLPYITGDMIS